MSRAAILQSPLTVTAVGIAALVTVGACAPTGSSSGGSGSVTAMCSLTSSPHPSATPPQTSTPRPATNATGMAGVILPDTTRSTSPARYPLYDAPLLDAALGADGITSNVIGTPFPLPAC